MGVERWLWWVWCWVCTLLGSEISGAWARFGVFGGWGFGCVPVLGRLITVWLVGVLMGLLFENCIVDASIFK